MTSVYEVFAYWNGKDIFNALNSVALIMGGDDYLGLMKAVGLVGLLSAVTYALLTQRGQTMGTYLMGFVFVYGVIFVPKVSVVVNDIRAAKTYVVANVPLGLAAPYALISRMGNFLTQQYEATFTSLDDERYSKTGMVFGARVLETMAMQGFPDPSIKADVTTFYKDCIVPELAENGSLGKTLKTSKDLASSLQSIVNPGRGTVLSTVTYAGSSTMSCSDVIPAINAYLTASNAASEAMGKIGRVVRADEGTSLATAALATAIETDVGNMLGNMLAISGTAQEALAQSMWINGIHDADLAVRNGYGNAQATSYAVAVTEQSSRQSAYAGKMWAEKALPLIRNLAEFVLIAAFPLIFIILLVSGENALRVLKLHLTVLTSLALWAPFTAILNSLVINNGKQAMQAMLASGGGITLDNMNGLIDLALQQQALAGQLFLAVPMIAFALVSGGAQAATAAVGGLTSSASGAAGQVSGQVAQGNVSGGQVGWSNVNAFNTTTGQSNTAMTMRRDFVQIEDAAGTTVMGQGAPGGGTFNGRSSQLGNYSASIGTALDNAFGKKVDSEMSASRSSISSALQSIRDVHSSGFRTENSAKAMKAFEDALATNNAAERAQLAQKGVNYTKAGANEAAASDTAKTAQTASLGGGLSFSTPGAGAIPSAQLNAGANFSTGTEQLRSEGSKASVTGGSDERAADSTTVRTGTVGQQTLKSGATNERSTVSGTQSQFEKAAQFGLQGQAQAQHAQKTGEQLSASRTDSGAIRTDLAGQVVSAMGGAQAAAQLYATNQSAFGAAVKQAAESIIASQGLGPGSSTQFAGVSGGAPVTSQQINDAQTAVEAKVLPQLQGAPEMANATPAQLKAAANSSKGGTGSGAGSSPLGRHQANPFTPSANGELKMPGAVAAASGEGQIRSADVAADAKTAAADLKSSVKQEAATTEVMANAVQGRANNRIKK